MQTFRLVASAGWVLWMLGPGIVKGLETVLLGYPMRAVTALLARDFYTFLGGLVTGAGFSVVWLAVATAPTSAAPGVLCTAYLAQMVYLLACVVSACLAFSHHSRGCTPPSLVRSLPYLTLPAGGYLGLLLGLGFAYPVASHETPGAGSARPDEEWHEWCRPHERVPVWILLLVVFGIGLVGTFVALPVIPPPPSGPSRWDEREERHDRRARRRVQRSHSGTPPSEEEVPLRFSRDLARHGYHEGERAVGSERAH